ncbi:hypothetical protein [Haloechinothrix sp. LS1_15]|uniref:hypothetical protein n=1 Tax=Haloechinothrix sp. LS1_15 TaxID=2652248 RepID=UPI0029442315|nr:hypothetical protein [Haloechinothrix sp. LS1_15]MDV6013226.1 hypothetical protein [Haloechinothrix sp. LS1_15]
MTVAVVACGEDGASERSVPELEPRSDITRTVTAEQRDVVSVLTLDAQVVANPRFIVAAPEDGTLVVERTEGERLGAVLAGEEHDIELPSQASLEEWLVDDGEDVVEGLPVATATWTGYGVVAEVAPEKAHRLYGELGPVRVEIPSGRGPFDCTLLGTVQSADSSGDMRVVCAPDDEVRVHAGAPALMGVTTGRAEDVVAVPVEAVAGVTGTGSVDVVDSDGERVTREVELGITDGVVIEVRAGLDGGEELAVPAPGVGS